MSTICRQLRVKSDDGKTYKTNCANVKSAFRIIQSVPSSKAEPFKQWLAQVGYERVQEIENPELGQQRTRELYKAKGYPDDWIEKRLRSIAIRDELTGEWKNRQVTEHGDFAILTAEIAKATFGLNPSDHKKVKGLTRENLRDHMTDLELLFSMLGEASTTEITRKRDAQGFNQNRDAARAGGDVAGNARRELGTKETGKAHRYIQKFPPGKWKGQKKRSKRFPRNNSDMAQPHLCLKMLKTSAPFSPMRMARMWHPKTCPH